MHHASSASCAFDFSSPAASMSGAGVGLPLLPFDIHLSNSACSADPTAEAVALDGEALLAAAVLAKPRLFGLLGPHADLQKRPSQLTTHMVHIDT